MMGAVSISVPIGSLPKYPDRLVFARSQARRELAFQ
jgi:hypothetical protein